MKSEYKFKYFGTAGGSILARGSWIEIEACQVCNGTQHRRSSQEGRGLKCSYVVLSFPVKLSILARGSWIEILYPFQTKRLCPRRSSQEGRGLKYPEQMREVRLGKRRSSQEGRGLKYDVHDRRLNHFESILARGSWIEIKIFVDGRRV